MTIDEAKAPNWRAWIAPGIIIAGLAYIGSQIDGLDGRLIAQDAKIDRRADAIEARIAETNRRIDKGLEQQADLVGRAGKLEGDVARMEGDLTHVRERVDRIAEKLEVAAVPPDSPSDSNIARQLEADPVGALRNAGYDVRKAEEAFNTPTDYQKAIPMIGIDFGSSYIFNPKKKLEPKN